MKAMVYSPYWDTGGGGEKYCAAVVQVLLKLDYQVTIAWNDKQLSKQLKQRFEIDISSARIDKEAFLDITTGNFWHKKNAMWKYDVIFFVSDGSLPFLFGQGVNIVHFQVPFHDVSGRSTMNRIKKMTIDEFVCNSNFTKNVIDSEFGVNSAVLYPPATMLKPGKKQQTILSVGRFDNLMQSKRQDVMIDVFKQLNLKDWKLVLAGGVLHGNEQIENLEQQAEGYAIDIVVNPSWQEIVSLYESASIYWHAAGFQVDMETNPEQAEHFGISVVEAMSAGSVPIVFDGGGLQEIVKHGENGFLWKDVDELRTYTLELIRHPKKMIKLASAAKVESKKFSMEAFERGFEKIIS